MCFTIPTACEHCGKDELSIGIILKNGQCGRNSFLSSAEGLDCPIHQQQQSRQATADPFIVVVDIQCITGVSSHEGHEGVLHVCGC